MQQTRRGNSRGAQGFSLFEVLLLVVVLAVLAAIVLPKFVDSGRQSREAALHNDLKLLRNAISLFHADTGYYPTKLADLTATSAPTRGLDSAGKQREIAANDWHGPYIEILPEYPFAGKNWEYSTSRPKVGQLNAAAPYDAW